MMPVAILCGGLGTRLGAETKDKPKSLVDVNGKPFIVHQLDLLKRNGYTDIVLLTGHLFEQIESLLGAGDKDVTIRYANDGKQPLGPVGAIRAALPLLGDRFFTLYGDSYLECEYARIERAFRESGAGALRTEWQGIDWGLSAFRKKICEQPRIAEFHGINELHESLRQFSLLMTYPMPHRWLEIGSPEGLAEVRAYLRASSTTESGATSP